MPDTKIGKKEQTAIGEAIDFAEYAGQGFENQTQDDISIPFIGVLQSMSPQLETVEGAKAGRLINTVTENLYDSVEFVAAVSQHLFVEWVPRNKGGGFVGIHEINSDVVAKAKDASKEFGKYLTPDGNELSETFYLYGVLVENDEPVGMAVIAFVSTKIKVYKNWNTRINMYTVPTKEGGKINPPMFAHRVKLSTIKQQKNADQFYNFVLQPVNGDIKSSLLPTSSPIFQAAVECKKMIAKGTAKAAYDSQNVAGDGQASPVF